MSNASDGLNEAIAFQKAGLRAQLEKMAEEARRDMPDPAGNPSEPTKNTVWASAPRRRLRIILRQLLAVETLLELDTGWLRDDVEWRIMRKATLLGEALNILERFELDR